MLKTTSFGAEVAVAKACFSCCSAIIFSFSTAIALLRSYNEPELQKPSRKILILLLA
jgi:hypothetical protein